ncbi:bifunctional hydroxymethylpyrimidine kinase/phosphomethylpyrimidine kinase [Cellulomonas sp. zg-ZUI199]|uniref:Bifunctional hydroxymethylpyrimidine kinase/phosphomethylpyrimidine kinase n=1 Tax=Cellulomonas wangleii TaxID=2816956 RepID=A0ABX8D8P1_9CELL|nr:bifunctional hydroxymethylpyrimidine kinase/phosphomethylpyrimidine kinase [Cellulomonas wangleii]MBO0925660.1 bifunctional hydroxymethylpyrimidine kinase/phosphomethylpyrimidine kinase [Cellulomonas wangleii]QVI63803.1 bifunctional hydroxymethylpyrimidine kinase/phosphomethylpyrimidine kinase [Cellulomonas wangleii]
MGPRRGAGGGPVSAAPAAPATGARLTGSRVRVLSVAGTDPTGGAGVHADLKSFAAHGAYGMAVVTALVAQNTHGVREVHVPGVDFLRAQLDAVSDDVVVDAVKIGMLGTRAVADEVAAWLARTRPPVVVLDPVMVASSGDRLLDADAEDAVRRLVALADLVTPNLPELGVLLGEPAATTWPGAVDQARRLAHRSGVTVLLKGGHLAGDASPDAVVGPTTVTELGGARVRTTSTHGTGCSLSAAVAALRPRRPDWVAAAREAKEWLTGAIAAGEALAVGSGRGPVDHLHHAPTLGARPFSVDAWERAAGLRGACDDLPFVRGLADGTLPVDDFEAYLHQDALYLAQYSRVLARASQLAPGPAAQVFFAQGAARCLDVEARLHEERLTGSGRSGPASPATTAYVDHLLAVAATGSYAEVVAAVLPCYVLYADLGARILARAGHLGAHPYGDWVATYGDPAFAAAADRASDLADAAAREVGAVTRARMLAAYAASCAHEVAFFDQVRARPLAPVG